MGRLNDWAEHFGTDKAATFHDYCPIYEDWIGDRPIQQVVEIGVLEGASLRMWRAFFPDDVRIVGMDLKIPPPIPGVELREGNALDRDLWEGLAPDLVVDDGSHQVTEQLEALKIGWPLLQPGGLWVIEDAACAYWPWAGSLETWQAFWLERIHDVNFWGQSTAQVHPGHPRRRSLMQPRNHWQDTLKALYFANAMVGLEKW